MDIAFEVAEAAVESSYDTLPPSVIAATKHFMLDSVAVAVAGSTAAGIQAGLDFARENGGTPQATLLVFGDRLPATAAAMINGTLCQARDFDAVYEPGVLLPYGPVIAAAFATGELVGASGPAVLHAIVLGADLTCRLGRALTKGLGWSRTATLGVFGSALASARLLDLSREQTVSALGLALSQSSGNIQTVIDGSLAKRYQAGFAAEAGVKSAMLARSGVTGPANVFEGRCGFFNLYESGSYLRELVTRDLGSDYEGTRASIKPFPCARELHGALAAALELRSEGLIPGDVRSVTIRLPPNAFALSGKPFRRSEASLAMAIGNASYGVAVALCKGAVTLDDYEEQALARGEVLDLIELIKVVEDTAIADGRALVPQSVTVEMRDGNTRTAVCERMPGGPENALSENQIRAKLIACLARSARPRKDVSVERLKRAIDDGRSADEVIAATT